MKPCPFCGGPVNVYYSSATKAFFWIHTDKAKDCIETTPDIMHGKYKNLDEAYADTPQEAERKAADWWNRGIYDITDGGQ